jgi:hypothetical protein
MMQALVVDDAMRVAHSVSFACAGRMLQQLLHEFLTDFRLEVSRILLARLKPQENREATVVRLERYRLLV